MNSGEASNKDIGNTPEDAFRQLLHDVTDHVADFYSKQENMPEEEYDRWLKVTAREDIDTLGKHLVDNLFDLCDNMTTVAEIESRLGLIPIQPGSYAIYADLLDIPPEMEDEAKVSKGIFNIMREAALELVEEKSAKHPPIKRIDVAKFEQSYSAVVASFDTIVSLLTLRNSVVDMVGIIKKHLGLPGIDNDRMKMMLEEHLENAKARYSNPIFIRAVERSVMLIHDTSVERQNRNMGKQNN